MKYALGNMLNGAGGLNPDGLSLDLQFAADKTLTARKGPTPVFTRASSGTFVGSDGLIQSADNNVARFDHDLITLACKGLLIEESRTNNCYNSNLLTTASWVLNGATIATSDTAPDGSAAFEVTETAATSGHNIANTGGATSTPVASITSGVTYTLSVFVKKSTGSIDWIQITGTGTAFGTAQYANFNLATGAIGNYTGVTSGTVPKMEQFPNGWWRCSITLTAIATGSGNTVPIQLTNNINTTTRGPSYTGNTANKVKVAMGQFEAGSFATSYIPNVASSGVIRSADVCSITGSAFSGFWNNNEGTVFASGDPRAAASIATYLMANSGTNANQVAVFKNTTTNSYGVANSGSYTANISVSAANGSFNKIAGSYITNDARAAFNNVLGTPDTSVIVPTNLTRLNIGSSGIASSEFTNGCISAIRYYKKSLSNAKLQSITA